MVESSLGLLEEQFQSTTLSLSKVQVNIDSPLPKKSGKRGRPKKNVNNVPCVVKGVSDIRGSSVDEVEKTWMLASDLAVTSSNIKGVMEELRRSKRVLLMDETRTD